MTDTDAGEIDAERVLETAQHHLKDLAQVLVNADRVSDAIQKLHSLQLNLELALGEYEILDVGVRTEPLEDASRRIAQWHRARLEPAIHTIEAANAEAQIIRIAARHDPRPLHLHLDAIVRVNLLEPAAP